MEPSHQRVPFAAAASGSPSESSFQFFPEPDPPIEDRIPVNSLKLLTVDDDQDFQKSLAFTLADMTILGRPIEVTQCFSMAEASAVLAGRRDFGVVLLDVVMETNDAGLRLVKAIREVLGNSEIRIVLVTGQPGLAPIADVMRDCDINEYCMKPDLSLSRLVSILTAEFRTFAQLTTISTARRGLQLIVESSNRLLGKRDLESYCDAALTEVALLLDVAPEGVVCVRSDHLSRGESAGEASAGLVVVGVAGRLGAFMGQDVCRLPDEGVVDLLAKAAARRADVETEFGTALFFPRENAGADFIVFVATRRSLIETERQLLRVFATNISGGLQNVALFSRLDQLAYEDSDFGLPNSNALIRSLAHALSSGNQADLSLAVVDIDQFGNIAHGFGAEFGNKLLRQFSDRLAAFLQPPAVLARIGFDRFAILADRQVFGRDIVGMTLAEPFDIDGVGYRMTACRVLMPLDNLTGSADDLVRLAHVAMKEAKRKGQGSAILFDKAQDEAAIERFSLLCKLQRGFDANELFLVYQPKIALSTDRVEGVEALLRWRCDGRVVLPDSFIPVAEDSAMIHRLGLRVVEQACDDMHVIDAAGFPSLTVSVNVSGRQFSDPSFMKILLGILDQKGVPPQRMELEVTETVAMEAFDLVSESLRTFRRAGGTVSIDDFGSGYSSLKYLNELPADILKIDRAFVSAMETESKGGSIAAMVVQLARSLHFKVIAEGVETEAQAMWLRELGCDFAQGWYYGRPMARDDLVAWLRAR